MGTIVIMVIVILILGIVVAYIILSARQFDKDGKVAEGWIVEIKGVGVRPGAGFEATCSYRSDEGIETATGIVSGVPYDQLQTGTKVSLVYLPYNPKEIMIKSVLGQPGTNPPEHA